MKTWNNLPEDVTSAKPLATLISSPFQYTPIREIFS